jgi:hypothetical protein
MQDFPAAHSMDTDWFSADIDGNIGYFSSGECGAVPLSIKGFLPLNESDDFRYLFQEMTKDLPDRVFQLNASGAELAKTLTLQNLQDDLNKWLAYWSDRKSKGYCEDRYEAPELMCDCLLLLSSEEVIPELEIAEVSGGYGLRFAGEPVLVFVNECYFFILQDLIDRGKILAGKEIETYDDEFMGLLGLFYYSCEEQRAVPYKLMAKPNGFVKTADIPQHIAEIIEKNRFANVKFAERDHIQPIEHTECNAPEYWISTDGKQYYDHPIYVE